MVPAAPRPSIGVSLEATVLLMPLAPARRCGAVRVQAVTA